MINQSGINRIGHTRFFKTDNFKISFFIAEMMLIPEPD